VAGFTRWRQRNFSLVKRRLAQYTQSVGYSPDDSGGSTCDSALGMDSEHDQILLWPEIKIRKDIWTRRKSSFSDSRKNDNMK
jgi:hypothetical protein